MLHKTLKIHQLLEKIKFNPHIDTVKNTIKNFSYSLFFFYCLVH